jgi:hypothetical protein
MDLSNGTRQRATDAEPVVALDFPEERPNPVNGTQGGFGYHIDEVTSESALEEDDIQGYTRCNACWGRCMPRRMCLWWYDMWPCCRPVGMRIPKDDPMNPKTNLRLLFFTLVGIVAGLIGGFIVRLWQL